MFKLRSVAQLLGAACAATMMLVFVVGAQAASTAVEVRKAIEDLEKVLKDFDGKDGATLADSAIALRKKLLDKKLVPSQAAADAFVLTTADIKQLVEDRDSLNTILGSRAALVAATIAIGHLNTLAPDMPDESVKLRFIALLAGLKALIDDSIANRTVLTEALRTPPAGTPEPTAGTPAAMDKVVREARGRFDTAWARISETYKIHIVSASFGDLRTERHEGRQCWATSYMMARCEAKPECNLEVAQATEVGKPYAQQVLCGFDPAPLVDDRYKGVEVHFACLRGGKDIWDKLAEKPGFHPVTGERWVAHKNSSITVLRSSGMELRCPFPVGRASALD